MMNLIIQGRSAPNKYFAQNNAAQVVGVEKNILGQVNLLAKLLTIAV
jgi:hypothetical protein